MSVTNIQKFAVKTTTIREAHAFLSIKLCSPLGFAGKICSSSVVRMSMRFHVSSRNMRTTQCAIRKVHVIMLISSKLLPVLALVTALAPMAANAKPVLAPLSHQDPVMPSGATIDDPTTASSSYKGPLFLMQPSPAKYDVAPMHHNPLIVRPAGATIDKPTRIYTGWQKPMFPVARGG